MLNFKKKKQKSFVLDGILLSIVGLIILYLSFQASEINLQSLFISLIFFGLSAILFVIDYKKKHKKNNSKKNPTNKEEHNDEKT